MVGRSDLRRYDCCHWDASLKTLLLLAALFLSASPSVAVDYDSQAEDFCEQNQELCTYMAISLGLNTLCGLYGDGVLSDAAFTKSMQGILQDVMLENGVGAQQALSTARTKYSCSDVQGWEELLPRK